MTDVEGVYCALQVLLVICFNVEVSLITVSDTDHLEPVHSRLLRRIACVIGSA